MSVHIDTERGEGCIACSENAALFFHQFAASFLALAAPRTCSTSTLPLPPPPFFASRMDWTDVHYRQLARLLSRHTWLYTEMVVDATLLHNPDADR